MFDDDDDDDDDDAEDDNDYDEMLWQNGWRAIGVKPHL